MRGSRIVLAVALATYVTLVGCGGETAREKLNRAAQRIVDSDPRWARLTVDCYVESTCWVYGAVARGEDRDAMFTALWERLPERSISRVDNTRVQVYR